MLQKSSDQPVGTRCPALTTITLTRRWVLEAQAGARMVYGHGFHARDACASDLREYILALHELGLVSPVQRRSGGGKFDYMIERTQRAVRQGARL